MAQERTVHIIALSSLERAEQARACFALEFHAEIYANYDELLVARPYRGVVLAEDIDERGGIGALTEGMAAYGFWLPVVATAASADPRRVVEAVRCGALDYVPLPLEPERLRGALERAVAEGEAQGAARRLAVEARVKLSMLTTRENEVLDLLVAGSSNKVIARELAISPRTVEIHRANMMAKLDANHPADAVRMRLQAAMAGSTLVVPSPGRSAQR